MFPSRTLLVVVILSHPGFTSAFFGWFARKSPQTRPSGAGADPGRAPDLRSLPSAPFEMTTSDDKFLAEAKHLELSPLDGCHHKVVSQLQASCTEMSEEEIAKLGVSLFNCQAEVEGRPTYPCTPDMTLAECTSSMDPDTWNAYHIVSNRARSVCYAARQLHFRRRTELTVNTLVSTAMNQLEAMKMLKDGQEELKELTAESLQKVVSSQNELLNQQEQLQNSQETMEQSINGNLEMLAEEKALIASGHHLVAQLIEGITRRMENVSSQLVVQDAELQEGHKAILADLSEVRTRSHDVYSKIESNLDLFLSYQNRTALYYDVLMEKLNKMNRSLGTVLYAMEHMHRSVEQRLGYIQGFVDWAGGNINAIYTCVLHGAYFLLLALLMTFLQTPGFSRAVLLLLILCNALSELNQHTSLSFRSLTALLVCTVTAHWMLVNFLRCVKKVRSRKSCAALPPTHAASAIASGKGTDKGFLCSTPERPCEGAVLKEELGRLADDSYLLDDSVLEGDSLVKEDSLVASPANLAWKSQRGLKTPSHSTPAMKLRRLSISNSVRGHETPSKQDKVPQRHLGAAFDAMSESRNYSPNSSVSSNVSVSSMSPRNFCQALTRAGQPCRNKASGGQEFCRVHASGQTSYAAGDFPKH
ncbi:protein brambleberry-like [Spea bombifrons]|uniref:protein brambleberry-like n=1 Tax=Spea bombifrons TaxID=233779 RepID=UPI0023493872|nr:protein brambleberry-like [Spea bombifrons]